MRHLLTGLSEAGYSAHALDLRGTGASDKPPEGYALPMLARDVAGVIGALGHKTAVVVGSGFGGQVAWTMLTRAPEVLDGIVPVSSSHPGSLIPKRRALVSPRAFGQVAVLRSAAAARRLLTEEGFMGALLTTWVSDPDAIDADDVANYTAAMRIPFAADKAARMLRWSTRPLVSAAHARFVASTRRPAETPILHVLTDHDPLLRWTICPVPRLGGRDYTFELLLGAGHLPAEEIPDALTRLIIDWLKRRDITPA
jgi:pimeloyl-ACP methyl ester carboxylesterase